jgi:CRP-like cAMP-binding protein
MGKLDKTNLFFRVRELRTVNKKVNTLGKKGYFGELALLNNAPRIATVRCIETCYFGVLSRQSFKEIIGSKKIYLLLFSA